MTYLFSCWHKCRLYAERLCAEECSNILRSRYGKEVRHHASH